MKHPNVQKGMCHSFEEHVRCLLATGTTARQTREGLLLNAGQFLKEDECSEYQSEIPVVEWFSKQREALGVESYLYTFMRIAGCETIQQWGFDETKIDGHDTFNQWAMLIDPSPLGNGKPSALFLFITPNSFKPYPLPPIRQRVRCSAQERRSVHSYT